MLKRLMILRRHVRRMRTMSVLREKDLPIEFHPDADLMLIKADREFASSLGVVRACEKHAVSYPCIVCNPDEYIYVHGTESYQKGMAGLRPRRGCSRKGPKPPA